MTLGKHAPRRAAKQVTYTPRPRTPPTGTGMLAQVMAPSEVRAPMLMKTPDRKSQRIRDSARNEECSVRIPGVCLGGTETTVWSHFPGLDGGRGMGLKSLDLCGAFACMACHDVVDMRSPAPAGYSRLQVIVDWCMGHLKSLVRLRQKGLA